MDFNVFAVLCKGIVCKKKLSLMQVKKILPCMYIMQDAYAYHNAYAYAYAYVHHARCLSCKMLTVPNRKK